MFTSSVRVSPTFTLDAPGSMLTTARESAKLGDAEPNAISNPVIAAPNRKGIIFVSIFRSKQNRILLTNRPSGHLLRNERQVQNIYDAVAIHVRARIEAGLTRFLSKRSLHDGQVVAANRAVAIEVTRDGGRGLNVDSHGCRSRVVV